MLFTSYEFLVFFVFVYVFYLLASQSLKLQNVLLLGASYFFYGFLDPFFCLLLFTTTFVDFSAALLIGNYQRFKKLVLACSIGINLAILGVFKYFNFFVDSAVRALSVIGIEIQNPLLINVLLPVGISFYTFQSMSYLVDVYRGNQRPNKNFLEYALYVCFFPQLVAGPIERAKALLPQIQVVRKFSATTFIWSVEHIIWGLVLKLVVAHNVAPMVDKIFMLEDAGFILVAAGSFGFAVQIYADFFGYTLIARGLAGLLGFHLSVNFQDPYKSFSPSEFWRRWHISLSEFVRDYVYISLGGSRRGVVRLIFALTATMLLMGLWHGADWKFVAWGVYHGLLLAAYHLAGCGGDWSPRRYRFSLWLLWTTFAIIGWSIFRSPDLSWWLQSVISSGPGLALSVSGAILICLKVCCYSIPFFYLRLCERYLKGPLVRGINGSLLILSILLFSANPDRAFIYFQF